MSTPPEAMEWKPYDPCPCPMENCTVTYPKLNKRGHCVGCKCPPCKGKRNRKKGQAAERRAYLAGGGKGRAPADESGLVLELRYVAQVKQGQQVPKNFIKFLELEWTRHALSQAERVIAVGSQGAYPALDLQPEGGGEWLLVRIK